MGMLPSQYRQQAPPTCADAQWAALCEDGCRALDQEAYPTQLPEGEKVEERPSISCVPVTMAPVPFM